MKIKKVIALACDVINWNSFLSTSEKLTTWCLFCVENKDYTGRKIG